MLTAKQHELIRFIQEKLEETGISPSFEEMKEALDLKSKSGVHRLISALEERGFIRRLAHRAMFRAWRVLAQHSLGTFLREQSAARHRVSEAAHLSQRRGAGVALLDSTTRRLRRRSPRTASA